MSFRFEASRVRALYLLRCPSFNSAALCRAMRNSLQEGCAKFSFLQESVLNFHGCEGNSGFFESSTV